MHAAQIAQKIPIAVTSVIKSTANRQIERHSLLATSPKGVMTFTYFHAHPNSNAPILSPSKNNNVRASQPPIVQPIEVSEPQAQTESQPEPAKILHAIED